MDLELIYSQIHRGRYTTGDGLQIDGSLRGNFFSSDGISPTALGQAVIANEVIKAINGTYQTSIPAISIRSYVQTIGLQ
ncbi:MAG: hypothetical protein H7Z72_10715 [Bacteroidetes bacterium]|nr:hypothetical protein [Fibrella sp.]